MEVREGYKQSEVGVIPDSWIRKQLSDISEFITKGATPTTYGFKWESSGILFLRSECVTNNGLDLSKSMFISELAHKSLQRSEIRSNDLLITITGNVGRVVFLDYQFGKGNINQHIAKIRINDLDYDRLYVYHFLSQDIYRKYFESIVTGQAYPQISLKQVRGANIFFPRTKSEQNAIATALSDADALITSLEKLIEKKRAIKQGAMQELLKPKEGWETKSIGQYANLINGRAYALHEWEAHGTPVIRLQNLTGSGENYYYSKLKLAEKLYCDYNDLLFMWSATFGPIIWKGEKAIYHYHIWKIETDPKNLDKWFLFYILSDLTERIKKSSTSGGTMLHITKKSMEETLICIPSLEEQTRIATILSDMDAEITGLEQKLAKYKQIKQGMMQELLTGRIRLI